jgi:GrpB-like predicted nucleotidyltransferase (UPF0157 family)
MLRWLLKTLGHDKARPAQHPEYEPVYGLPRRAVEEWLARNPRLREEYERLRASVPGRQTPTA